MSSEEKTMSPAHKGSTPTHRSGSSSSSSQRESRPDGDNWEIIEGLKIGQTNVQKPDKHEGFMLKRRKWPLKGWHKRFFVLESGMLKYSKTPIDIQKGKLHGSIDVGLSVMSIKKKTQRIDLDTEEHIYHLKVKSQEVFDAWVTKLRHHRLYRQNEIVRSPRDANFHVFPTSPKPDLSPALTTAVLDVKPQQNNFTRQPSIPCSTSLPTSYSNSQTKVAAWLLESEEMNKCSKDLAHCQSSLVELSKLLQNLEILQRTQSAPNFTDMQANCIDITKKDKRVTRRWRTKSVSKDGKMQLQWSATLSTTSSEPKQIHGEINDSEHINKYSQTACFYAVVLCDFLFNKQEVPSGATMSPLRLHSSNPNLCADIGEYPIQPSPLPEFPDSFAEFTKLQEEFCLIAQKVQCLLKSAFNTVAIEKEKLKQMLLEQEHSGHSSQFFTLRRTLSQPSGKIHVTIPLSQQDSNGSRLSMSESVSEFFDAQEVLLSASSSENEGSDDESYVSDVSDTISEDNASVAENASRRFSDGELMGGAFRNGRRTCLPAPSPDTSSINLWNILRNNIGKDLSKVSMPVELNEPLNTLQHLCEELEYSELLDKAAETDDPYDRMVMIAAFAVSGYATTYYRATFKPFNPVLGETYECIREDKGFRFFAEQVSHHPPISACHCESKKFVFWQDVRWKNKFWGKSMEILPVGRVNVLLPKYGDQFEWNKVTTCIHNILSGQRWIEHYGEITIRNTKNNACICKLSFIKGSYWSSNVNEVQGFVMDQEGKVVRRLFGKWHEGLYCGVPPSAKCIWRPGSMPTNSDMYYGFTRFAIELNELDPMMKEFLPPTDVRFRPDQRYLEEGNIQAAASEKRRIEELQRERRRIMEESDTVYQPQYFKKVSEGNQRESWMSTGNYWELRKDPGFSKLEISALW